MNRILLALPLVLVGLSGAERIPVLSSPRALVGTSAAPALSYNAWGDTLVAARYGFLHRVVRSGDHVSGVSARPSFSATILRQRNLRVEWTWQGASNGAYSLCMRWMEPRS